MKGPDRRVSTPLGTFIKYMSILMVILYVALGLLVLAGGGSLINVPDHYVLPIGTALLGYGIFRSYRIYVLYFKNS
jgi:hypothetical protein